MQQLQLQHHTQLYRTCHCNASLTAIGYYLIGVQCNGLTCVHWEIRAAQDNATVINYEQPNKCQHEHMCKFATAVMQYTCAHRWKWNSHTNCNHTWQVASATIPETTYNLHVVSALANRPNSWDRFPSDSHEEALTHVSPLEPKVLEPLCAWAKTAHTQKQNTLEPNKHWANMCMSQNS